MEQETIYRKKKVHQDQDQEGSGKRKNNQHKYQLTQVTNYRSTLPVYVKQKKGGSTKVERALCGCQARLHPLVNNCFKCGRIVCSEEQAGPCFFCGHEVSPSDQPQVDPFGNDTTDTSYSKARNHLDKLLGYDQTLAKRTTVYDDQSDYFDMNKWSSEKERQMLLEKSELMEEETKGQVYTIDLLGRSVASESQHEKKKLEVINDIQSFKLQEDEREKELKRAREEEEQRKLYASAQRDVDGSIYISNDIGDFAPIFIDPNTNRTHKKTKKATVNRVQHDYYNLEVEV